MNIETVQNVVAQLQKIYDETGIVVAPLCCCCGDVILEYNEIIDGKEVETAWLIKFNFETKKYTLDEKSFRPQGGRYAWTDSQIFHVLLLYQV